MMPQWTLMIFLAFVSVSPFVYFRPAHVTVSIAQGKRAFHRITLPSCWHRQDGSCFGEVSEYLHTESKLHARDGDRLEFRFSASGELLIGFLDKAESTSIPRSNRLEDSPDHYALNIDQDDKVRRATEAEWSEARPADVRAETALPMHGVWGNRPEDLSFAGKIFPRSGPLLASYPIASSISMNDRYLTVHSWDGHKNDCLLELDDDLPCGRFYAGRYWIDLYEVASRKRLAALNGKAFNMGSDELFGDTEWIGDRYFVMPIERTLRKLLICDVNGLQATPSK